MRSRSAAAVVAAACLVLAWQMLLLSKPHMLLGDFRAFYCGGSVVLHGGNPYAAAPIMACESTPQPFGLHRAPHGLAVPVPFPGYAFALFVPFALLPFVWAAIAWTLLSLAALGAACALLARICDRSFSAVLAVFAFGFGVAIFTYGELTAFALLALACAAYAMKTSKPIVAAAAVCCAAILPNVAGPAFLALFIWEKRARIPLLAGGAVLLGLDLLVGGPSLAVNYFTSVLPAHAQSEIGYITQYGLTWILHAAGASNRLALTLANLSYAATAACGIWLAGVLARRLREPALVVLLPAAFAVIGGPFVHYSEITLALPALMLTFVRSHKYARTLLAWPVLLVAMPWQASLQAQLIGVFALAAFAIAALFLEFAPNVALRTAFACALYCAGILVCGFTFGPQIAAGTGAHLDPHLAQASWAEYIRENSVSAGAVWIAGKMPTWFGLVLFAAGSAFAAATARNLPLRGTNAVA